MLARGMIVLCVLAAGCAASHDPVDRRVPLESFCGAFFDALCEPLAACDCGERAVALCRAEGVELCRGFPSDAMVAAIAEGRLRYDGAAARALLETMESRARTCESFTDAIDWRVRDLLGFGGIFEGSVAAGEPCAVLGFELISECALGSCTAIGGTYVCRSAVGPGERCDSTHHCANLDAPLSLELGIEQLSLRCAFEDDRGGICSARVPEGGACSLDADCESGVCEGTCRARELDAPCLSSRECASGYCSSESRTCRPGDAPVGASCDQPRACASDVCLGGTCLPAGCATF